MRNRESYCPVCGAYGQLVEHHDHFGDFCYDFVQKLIPNSYDEREWCWAHGFYSYWDDSKESIQRNPPPKGLLKWWTFDRTFICPRCNSICTAVKRVHKYIPKCASFSPAEMKDLLEAGFAEKRSFTGQYTYRVFNASLVRDIWTAKKKFLYHPRLQKLLELGVSKEKITEAWNDRTVLPNFTAITREKMLKLVAQMPQRFQELCETPGNDIALAYMISLTKSGNPAVQWDPGTVNSFMYWYHKKHGDPGCKKDIFGYRRISDFHSWFLKASGYPFSY